ncbi:uncharacterized protein MELLADRAFT_77515 [Melampsora larici-populina 98AG31]|uniref:Uncharacterized protein n=1 Tax=Melampsora larici-populina (strain 98AG31 / pathotype 3-4-7) TaxID=747676 RepID=F4RIM8_MELLP|nr:uncharacterized protein MELLADRAFT_77515 [Melampsora larici-populina 98AG31]EGG07807.1 hypothetical protein MELLADRAFT_77515 [Melampsora larici-populina 98AG31]
MTQIKTNETSIQNPPADLIQIYQTIKNLIKTHQDSIELVLPLNLLTLISHAILITHQFKLKLSNPSDDQDQIGERITISGITVENDQVYSHDLSIPGYFDLEEFPVKISSNEDQELGSIGFRSTSHLLDFISLFNNDVLHHLLPDLIPKTSPEPNHQSSSSSSAPPPPPSAAVPSSTPTQPPQSSNPNPSSSIQTPFNIGQSDLDPIGTSNIRLPSLYNRPTNERNPLNSNDGMFVGPNHSIFNHHQSQNPSNLGPFGGDGFLPPDAVPHGARFDPIGPGTGFMPRPSRAGDEFDPMGGLGQGLPMGNPFPSRGGGGGGFPGSGGSANYDDMFM